MSESIDARDMSPLDIIELVKRMNVPGGPAGPPATSGYVDEHGRPLENPQFPGMGAPALPAAPAGEEAGGEMVEEGAGAPSPPSQYEAAMRAVLEQATPDFLDLAHGVGVWRGNEFKLGAAAIARVRREVVKAIQFDLRSKSRELAREVKVGRKRRVANASSE